MTVLECEGGIMQPDSFPERAVEFDDTGLVYINDGRKILARCPFSEQFCNVRCPMLIYEQEMGGTHVTYCSLSAHTIGQSVTIRALTPSKNQI